MGNKEELANRIRTARMSRDITQAELAEMVNVAPSTVGMWEQGRRVPSLDDLAALADVFNVPSGWLTHGEGSASSSSISPLDNERLEALHQNPRLGMLFDRQREMSDADIDVMLALAKRILKERDGDD